MTQLHDGHVAAAHTATVLLIILVVLAILFLAGGFSTRRHERYRTYSTPGMGLGGLLVIIVLVLYLTGNLNL